MSTRPARWSALLALSLLPGTAACIVVVDGDGNGHGRHSIRGSGVRVEEERVVGEFQAIQLEAAGSVVVRVGEGPSLRLAGDDNVLPHVETRVSNGVLTIDVHDSVSYRCGLELVIGTPALERFTIEGSGDVRIENLAAEHVELAIEGSGTIAARGHAHELVGSIEGSGSLELAELQAVHANLSIEGSGSMDVHAAEGLHYSIEGSGEILYAGNPGLAGRIDGSGSVERRR